MKKRKVCVVITTRGNCAKMKPVMKSICQHPKLELQVIVGGSAILPKYGNIVGLLKGDDMQIVRMIHFLVEGENPVTMAKSAGLVVTEFITTFENLRPDVVNIKADRFEREYGYFRPVIQEVVERYLDCGNSLCGFAQIRCPDCGEERLLCFSCKTRGFCP